jgi:hypothetical protein
MDVRGSKTGFSLLHVFMSEDDMTLIPMPVENT